jgi:hypothetical protein
MTQHLNQTNLIKYFNETKNRIGQIMPDKTVYSGVSPVTNTPMYSVWMDTGYMSLEEILNFLAHGKTEEPYGLLGSKIKSAHDLCHSAHRDDGLLRLPHLEELELGLYRNKNEIGLFLPQTYLALPSGPGDCVSVLDFTDGYSNRSSSHSRYQIRLVRTEPR